MLFHQQIQCHLEWMRPNRKHQLPVAKLHLLWTFLQWHLCQFQTTLKLYHSPELHAEKVCACKRTCPSRFLSDWYPRHAACCSFLGQMQNKAGGLMVWNVTVLGQVDQYHLQPKWYREVQRNQQLSEQLKHRHLQWHDKLGNLLIPNPGPDI